MKRIPMCWKCANRIADDSGLPGAPILIGCKEHPGIKSWAAACVLCPLIQPKKVKHDSNFCEGQRD